MKFNGANISLADNVVTLKQPDHIAKVQKICEDSVDQSSFVSQRVQGAYIASVCRPDLTFGFAVSSKVVETDKIAARLLNKAINRCKSDEDLGLTFVQLDRKSIRIVVFADASIASNADLSSQLGIVIGLADNHNKANIVQYSSFKSKRVTRSVLSAKLFAVVHAFDIASTLRKTIIDMFGRLIPMTIFVDSNTLYDAIVGINSTTKKRLLIDLAVLRQAYEIREIV